MEVMVNASNDVSSGVINTTLISIEDIIKGVDFINKPEMSEFKFPTEVMFLVEQGSDMKVGHLLHGFL